MSIDPAKKDPLVAHLTAQLDSFRATAGLSGIRVIDAAGNRMVVTAVYKDQQSVDSASQKTSGVRESASDFLTGEPFVREGDVAWRYVADGAEDRPTMPGYARHLAVAYDPSAFDKMLEHLNSQNDMYKSIDGLRRILVTPVSGSVTHPGLLKSIGDLDNRMIVTVGYDSKTQSVSARDKMNTFWQTMTNFLTDEPRILEGDFIYGFSNR